jgi:LmbE family N-acetylglucosaminyl deacetylase
VLDAVMRAGRPPALLWSVFPPGLFLPQYEKCIGMMGDPPDPPAEAIGTDAWDYEIDIHAVRETKLAAIAAHRSQLPGGDPEAIFPPGIVAALLDAERFSAPLGVIPLPAPFDH